MERVTPGEKLIEAGHYLKMTLAIIQVPAGGANKPCWLLTHLGVRSTKSHLMCCASLLIGHATHSGV